MASDLLIFADDWGRFPSTMQHLVKNLANDHTIIWVNSLGMRRPRLSIYDLRRLWDKLMGLISQNDMRKMSVTERRPDHIIYPMVIPLLGNKTIQWLNSMVLSRQIKQTLNKYHINEPIVITTVPTALQTIKRIKASKCIYYCCDDFDTLSGVDNHIINQLEAELVNYVDDMVVVSETLQNKFNKKQPLIIHQGVDHQLFTQLMPKPSDWPAQSMVIGFCGSIEPWVDLALIEKIAQQFPQAMILMVGPIKTDVTRLYHYQNIKLLGMKPYKQVAAYMQHWDVSILPFCANSSAVQCCDPLKLREYLAAGKPVVVTDIPVAKRYQSVISIANSHEEFIDCIHHYYKKKDVIGQEQRRLSVKDDGWPHRVKQLQQLFVDNLTT